MAITAKPTVYTVNTGHAKCPDHLYMLDDSTGGTTVADGVGSLDLTADGTGMWNTDATYGQIMRFVSSSSQKAISGTSFAASSGICLVVICKTTNATMSGTDEYPIGMGSSSAGIYGGAKFESDDQTLYAVCDSGGTTNLSRRNEDVYDATWHMIAVKFNDTTGSDSVEGISIDGDNWTTTNYSGSGDSDLAQFTRIALGCVPQSSLNGFFDGDILAAMVYVDDYSTWDDTWIASLYDDPWQFLSTTTKKLKLLAHSSAASATGVAGVVFAAPTGGAITGTEIGEFTGAEFEATLESGEAVLKVAVSEFGGTSLTTSDTPVALVRNSTYTTGIVSCTVIEE